MCVDNDWKVENGLVDSFAGLALTLALILSIEDSENLKIFSFSGGGFVAVAPSPFCCSGGVRSSFTRVLRAWVRSRKG
ncbi:hypothetical protein HanRHA438_Chr14g0681831 [Helianthus annuus]|nr:hypothetical protein HanIR_Chr14g0727471 [Helianthus annuus]KAJ0856210.1 hypothetical protein HanRHA438_Chr14g0681831 [Helianthus annuus]